MAEINVTIQNAGPQINANLNSAQAELSVSVQGAGPRGPQGNPGAPGPAPEIRDGYWWTYNWTSEQWENTGTKASAEYEIGSGLILDEASNTLRVDTATTVEEDNTRPITSAAVYTTVGNIEILLETI